MLLVHARPDITTGLLLEYFAEREEAAALQKLAVLELPGEDDVLRQVFIDNIERLDAEALGQRREELQQLQRDGTLGDADKQELRALLQAMLQR